MKRQVLIGPLSNDPAESVSAVNRSFVQGLTHEYDFVALPATRKYGNTRQSLINGLNFYYFAQQLLIWSQRLASKKIDVAHYAISSGWAMEKGLAFLRIARVFGTRTIGHLHSGGFLDHWKKLPSWRRRLAIHELKQLDAFIVLSEGWKTAVAEELGFPLEKIFVVNNPIEQRFEEAALKIPIEGRENVILCLGALCKEKGVLETWKLWHTIGLDHI